MTHLLAEKGLGGRIFCDSAGTSALHQGAPPDPRSMAHAGRRGYDMKHICSRPFKPETDFQNFQYILAMDNSNYIDILACDPKKKHISRVYRITQFASKHSLEEVPDPYHSGPEGFELVLNLLEDSCEGLLAKIQADHNL